MIIFLRDATTTHWLAGVSQEFVHIRELFKEYDNTYEDCKRKADVYMQQDPQGTACNDRGINRQYASV